MKDLVQSSYSLMKFGSNIVGPENVLDGSNLGSIVGSKYGHVFANTCRMVHMLRKTRNIVRGMGTDGMTVVFSGSENNVMGSIVDQFDSLDTSAIRIKGSISNLGLDSSKRIVVKHLPHIKRWGVKRRVPYPVLLVMLRHSHYFQSEAMNKRLFCITVHSSKEYKYKADYNLLYNNSSLQSLNILGRAYGM